MSLELITPTKHADPLFVVRTETERIRAHLDRSKQQVIYLDLLANMLTTEQFVTQLEQFKNRSVPIVFLIG